MRNKLPKKDDPKIQEAIGYALDIPLLGFGIVTTAEGVRFYKKCFEIFVMCVLMAINGLAVLVVCDYLGFNGAWRACVYGAQFVVLATYPKVKAYLRP